MRGYKYDHHNTMWQVKSWFLSHVEPESWLIRAVNVFLGGGGVSFVWKERIFDSSVERRIQVCNLWWAAMCILRSWNLSGWPRGFQIWQYMSTVQVGLTLASLSSVHHHHIESSRCTDKEASWRISMKSVNAVKWRKVITVSYISNCKMK